MKPKPRSLYRNQGHGRLPPLTNTACEDGGVHQINESLEDDFQELDTNTNNDKDDARPLLCAFCLDPYLPGM